MSTYLMTIEVVVDDDLLAQHDGEEKPPPNDINEWYGGDLERAVGDGIAEIEHDQIRDIEKVAS